MLAGAARYRGRWLWPGFGLTDPLLRRVLLLMVPITITLGVLNFNALIGTWFAQFVSDRAAAEIGYAFRLYQLPQGIFAVTIGTVLFPSLSRFAAQKRRGAVPGHGLAGRAADGVRLAAVRRLVRGDAAGVRAAGVRARAVRRRRHGRGRRRARVLLRGARVRQLQHHAEPGLPEHAEAVAADVRELRQPGRQRGAVLAAVQAARRARHHAEHGDGLGGQLLRAVLAAAPRRGQDRRTADGQGGGRCAALRRRARRRLLRASGGRCGTSPTGGSGQLVVVVVVAVVAGGAVYLGLARLLRLEELSVVRQVLRRRGRS